jgi:hypothetical protein
MVLLDGAMLAKDRTLTATWSHEYAGVWEVAVASDSAHGPLIAIQPDTGKYARGLLVKSGSLSAGWDHEYSNVGLFAVASDAVWGPVIAATSGGELLVKEGSLTARWDREYRGQVRWVAVAG